MDSKPSELVKKAVSSADEHNRVTPALADYIKKARLPVCKEVIKTIKKIIKDKTSPPSNKLRALKLFHACMMVANTEFLVFAQKKVMSRLTILAQHKKQVSDENRGEDIFGNLSLSSQENKKASEEFLICLLRYIKIWASQFGRGPDGKSSIFYRSYNTLVQNSVAFPKRNPDNQSPQKKESPKKPSSANSIAQLKDTVDNTCSIVENLLDSESIPVDTLSELISSLKSYKTSVNHRVNETMSSGDSESTETLLALNECIEATLSKYENRKSSLRDSEGRSASKAEEERKHLGYDDMAPSSEFSQLQFATHMPNRSSLFGTRGPQHSEYVTQLNPKTAEPKEIQLLQNENSKLKRTIENRNSSQQKIQNLTVENSELKQQIQQVNKMIAETDEYINKLSTENTQLQNQNSELQSQLNYLQNTLDSNKGSFQEHQEAFSSSSDEYYSPQLVNSNTLFYRMCNCNLMGVIFDNELFQVGFQIYTLEPELVAMVYVGNKSESPIYEVTTHIPDVSQQGLQVSIEPQTTTEEVQQQAQAMRNLKASLIKFTSVIPKLEVEIHHEVPCVMSLMLPFTMTRFLKAANTTPQATWDTWKYLESFSWETQVQLEAITCLQELCAHLYQGGVFAIFTCQEISQLGQHQVLAAANFAKTSAFMVVTGNFTEMKALLEIRSQNNQLKEALGELMRIQLGGKD